MPQQYRIAARDPSRAPSVGDAAQLETKADRRQRLRLALGNLRAAKTNRNRPETVAQRVNDAADLLEQALADDDPAPPPPLPAIKPHAPSPAALPQPDDDATVAVRRGDLRRVAAHIHAAETMNGARLQEERIAQALAILTLLLSQETPP